MSTKSANKNIAYDCSNILHENRLKSRFRHQLLFFRDTQYIINAKKLKTNQYNIPYYNSLADYTDYTDFTD